MATHTAPTISPSSFDLSLYISEIPNFDLCAALSQSLARSVDFTIVNAARSLFKQVRTAIWEGDCTYDRLADLNSALNEAAFAEASFHAAGSDNVGYIETIKSLWPLREEWVAEAVRATSFTIDWQGNPKHYEPIDIETQICTPTFTTSKKTIGRIMRQVERKADELGVDDDIKAKTLASRIKREEANNADAAAAMRETAHGVIHMLREALKLDTEEVVTETNGARKSADGECHRTAHVAGKPDFHLLPYALRFKLINDTIRSCELQAEWACKNNSMTDDAFDEFDMLCSKTIKVLRGIINSPQFRAAMAQNSAAEAMTG